MSEIVVVLLISVGIALYICYTQKQRIKILENNWETAKLVISELDPTFKAHLERNE